MKRRLLLATYCTLLATLFGCGQTTRGTSSPSSGGYVKISDGRGTANVWGISFDVEQPVGESVGSRANVSFSTEPKKTDARHEITIGDVIIRLHNVTGSSITLEVNDKKYGTLEVGDNVSIDKECNVKVNGSSREAATEDS